ncbi:hypothetical protein PspLS_11890 [Pyricularia sp. CBS 133598]|nr:hypothetical protein PspLS_11890 [Pyricularia sp. CBS 133598]
MTRTKNAQKMAPSSRIYPKLHQDILQAMPENVTIVWEDSLDERARPRNQWVTNVMGRFTCRNRQCASGGWFSRTVGIWIRQFRGGRYNAIVYSQECELCGWLGWLTLDRGSYIERVAYWLKKWAGVPVEPPPHREKRGPPHKQELCEGCRRGFCFTKSRSGLAILQESIAALLLGRNSASEEGFRGAFSH